MSDTTDNRGEKVRSLRDAIRSVRTAEAERSDVVVELRDAERARLEILAEELRSVFAEVPAEDEQFIFSVAAGTPPRLWIDMTAFVVMGRDRRSYRFLKDTRLGRTVILETAKIEDMADTITHYVAERIIERERAMEGDWLIKRARMDDASRFAAEQRRDEDRRSLAREAIATAAAMRPRRVPAMDQRNVGWIVAAFLGGMLLAAIALFTYAWIAVG
ncbi:MAG TPA: hypothetical protein VHA70_15800 [Bauldia sp.]|nr:hypothetical protein [Bauldia sp.]